MIPHDCIWHASAGPFAVSVTPTAMLTGPGYLATVHITGKTTRTIGRQFRNLADALRFVGCPDNWIREIVDASQAPCN